MLFGTAVGIAFFMLMGPGPLVAHVASTVAVADFLFTATAAVFQPVTGFWFAEAVGWLAASEPLPENHTRLFRIWYASGFLVKPGNPPLLIVTSFRCRFVV